MPQATLRQCLCVAVENGGWLATQLDQIALNFPPLPTTHNVEAHGEEKGGLSSTNGGAIVLKQF